MTQADPDLAAAWDALARRHAEGAWQVGRPYLHDERRAWEQSAWLPTSRAKNVKPKKDWNAVGARELECVREMARCLRKLAQGRWPE